MTNKNKTEMKNSTPYRIVFIVIWICFIYTFNLHTFLEYFRSEYSLKTKYWEYRLYNLTYVPTKYKTSKKIQNPEIIQTVASKINANTSYDGSHSHLKNKYLFEFDGRPKEILYKTAREEVKLCTCGEYDCQEQESIKTLFKEGRPSFDEYKQILKDPKLSTSVKNSVVTVLDQPSTPDWFTVSITSKNGYNAAKTQGGDFWIVRMVARKEPTPNVKQIIIPPISHQNFKNGSYLFKMPFIPKTYTEKLLFKLEVYLERSAEMMEVNKRAMSSYHMIGRTMRVDLPLKKGGHKYGECGMFPLERSCDFSVSPDRTWYCYVEGTDCRWKNLKLVERADQVFKLAEVIEECSVGMMMKKRKKRFTTIQEINFQKLAFEMDYYEISQNHQNRRNKNTHEPHFTHWCYGRYVTNIQELEILESEIETTTKSVTSIKNSHPTSDRQLNEFYQKLQNRTLIIIGDSLLQQFLEYIVGVLHTVDGSCKTWKHLDFWGAKPEIGCPTTGKLSNSQITSSFSPKYLECQNKPIEETSGKSGKTSGKTSGKKSVKASEKPVTFTKFAFFPHGKPIHHGGCSKQRMPWMVDTIARIEKHADLNDRTVIILDPAAHFGIANPAFLLNRLLELKPVLVAFKTRNPQVKIIFRTPNYWPGDFYEQVAVISALNSKRYEIIIDELFGNSPLFEVVKVYEKTEVIFDQFTRSAPGIHPGSVGSAKWVLNEIVSWILDKF